MNEIQSKFLVSADIMRWLETHKYSKKKIEKFYIKSQNDTYIYCEKSDDTYKQVVRKKRQSTKTLTLTKSQYLEARNKHKGRKLLKSIYTVHIDEARYEIVVYGKKLKGLYLLFVSMQNEKVLRESEVLESLHSFVLKQIDQDSKYEDENLALCVKPMEYQLNKLFEKIDAYEAANLFFWQVPSRVYIRDGVCLILYKNLRLIHYYKVNYQRKHFAATLHRLRVLLRRTATILETFSDFFNPNVIRFCTELLLRYHEETKVLRYLYFLEELCSTKKEAKMRLYSELKTLISNEEKAVVQMLLSKPFGQLIQIITRELYDQEYFQYKSLKKEVKKAVKKRLKEFEALLSFSAKGYNNADLDRLYSSMDSLQTLIEDFYHIIGEEKIKYIVEEINILLKPLREYRNCQERKIILEAIKEQADNINLEVETLLCEHEKELSMKIDGALKLLRSSRFYL